MHLESLFPPLPRASVFFFPPTDKHLYFLNSMLSGMQNIIVFVWAGFLFFTEKRTALFISKGNKNGKKMLEICFN